MKITLGLLALLLGAGAHLSYFKYQRQLAATNTSGQRYVVVDETIWRHARPDLGDLRLYSAETEIPYLLEIERGRAEVVQQNVQLLQPGTLRGKTQFLLDMSGVPEYNRIQLKLAARNFVTHARVEGQDDAHGKHWAVLGTTTLYELSNEKLGANKTLQIPLTTYKYLRVTIGRPVKPSDVEGATAGMISEQKATWQDLSSKAKETQEDKNTVFTFLVPTNVPVDRVNFSIDQAQQGFERTVEIQDDKRLRIGSGELSRIHLRRNGQKIDVERTFVNLPGTSRGTLRVIIHNGDDAPLKISDARLQQYERRIYFDSRPGAQFTLYYGDEKLAAPVYDYAKLFHKDAGASRVEMGAEKANAAYTGRPDDRPWSERHSALLWVAIIAAVIILGGIALRSMKTDRT
jgi:Protein of unknown function (DUF3999)